MHRIDETIIAYAQEHWGTFPDAEVIRLDGSRMFIKRRLASGDWVRLAPGALGFPDWPPSFERKLWTGIHSGPARALTGPLAAAALYEFTDFKKTKPEIFVPHGSTHRNAVAVVRQTRRMPRVVRHAGFPVPERERVLCEVARDVNARKLGRALDDLLRARKVALPRVERMFLELATPGWRGLHTIGRVLTERGDKYVPTRSELELALRSIVESIPGLVVFYEKQIGDAEEMVHQVDCVVEEPAKLILEADGRAYHQRVEQMARDRQRDRRAAKLGYPTFRYVYGELTETRDVVRREIEEFISAESLRNGG